MSVILRNFNEKLTRHDSIALQKIVIVKRHK
jgi:hypothetical protein